MDPDGPSMDDAPTSYVTRYEHHSSGATVSIVVGLWMHKEQELAREAIADWLEVPYEGKELLEPINVLWVDSAARSDEEARDDVVSFLDACGFAREGKQLGLATHSYGYHAYYNGIWKEQYDADDAWVDRELLGSIVSSNHGRIFPSFQATSTAGRSVFFTSGAFSREGPLGTLGSGVECLFNVERCHAFQSFNQARDALRCGARGWLTTGLYDFGSAYPLSSGRSFSTGDHDGVLVFSRP
jgi:hypothetical protein